MANDHPLLVKTGCATAAGLLAAAVFSGCISIGTYEREMQKCRDAQANHEQLEKNAVALEHENADLRQKIAETTVEQKGLQEKITDVRSTYDDLIQRLQDDIASGAVEVGTNGEDVTVTLGNKVLFKSGQSALQPKGWAILKSVADVLRSVNDREIRVEGHTDNTRVAPALQARYPSNWELSSARAAAVVRYLSEKGGVDPARLVVVGFGEHRPVVDNGSAEGRQQNRRVEIFISAPPHKNKKEEK